MTILPAPTIALWLSISPLFAAARDSGPLLELRPRAQVDGGMIRVGDVCEIGGADEQLARRIRDTAIAPSPLRDRTHTVTLGWVKLALRRRGLDVKRIAFRGAAACEVTRSAPPAAARALQPAQREAAPAASSPAIARGTQVVVIVEVGRVRVTAVGETLHDAVIGETVRVRIAGTRAVVRGVLSEDRTVRLSCGSEAP